MAYLLEMDTQCDALGCKSAAKVRLLDWRNEDRGKFCRKHGKQQLRDRERFEKTSPHIRAEF